MYKVRILYALYAKLGKTNSKADFEVICLLHQIRAKQTMSLASMKLALNSFLQNSVSLMPTPKVELFS